MKWLSKLFSFSGSKVIDSVGKVLDDLVTTDEEMALTELQKAKIEAAYNVRIKELMLELDRQQSDNELALEKELTKRLEADMRSDSTLSKNIRPLSLIFMTALVAILAFYTTFNSNLSDTQVTTLKEWIPFLQILMLTMYGFYFGSRGLEKMTKIFSVRDRQSSASSSLNSKAKG